MTRVLRLARALRGCTSGLALTEFAFALPILLTLSLFGIETANYAMAHLRISNIAVLAADNAARVRESIDEADIVELFIGARMTGAPINFAQNGRIVLTDIEVGRPLPLLAPVAWIRWQRCTGVLNVAPRYGRPLTAVNLQINNGTEIYLADRTTQNLLGTAVPTLPAGRTTAPIQPVEGSAVMLVEVSYTYQPIIPNSFLSGRVIRYESAFNVRQRTDQSLRNAGRITPQSCDRFQAT